MQLRIDRALASQPTVEKRAEPLAEVLGETFDASS
jgi:hypothetical protein